jgi:hypothetical protein
VEWDALWKSQSTMHSVVSDYVHECRFVSPIVTRPSNHSDVMVDPSAPSQIRVLGKSLYVLAVGWFGSVIWLWVAELQQYIYRHYEAPPYYSAATVAGAIVPALMIAFFGKVIKFLAGKAPTEPLERREWWHAFWWSLVPNALLLVTVWVMIQEAK